MQLIVFVGLQGSGEFTYCHRHLVGTHIRLNKNMLRTRHRKNLLLSALIEAKQPTVIDNIDPTPEERARYIVPTKAASRAPAIALARSSGMSKSARRI